jgi:hypothetical protein
MLGRDLVFIKLFGFFRDLPLIPLVYMNGWNIRPSSFEEPSFYVAKDGDGRGGGHILIVYGMSLLAKAWLFKPGLYPYT